MKNFKDYIVENVDDDEYVDENGFSFAKYKEEVESDSWYGTDKSNEISLGEYHLLLNKNSMDKEGNVQIIYFDASSERYNDTYVNVKDLADDIKRSSDFESFCDSVDVKPEDIDKLALERPEVFLSDINWYWGLYNWV